MNACSVVAIADPALPWTWAIVSLTFVMYLVIGWRSRVGETAGFYVAGQGVPAIANGAATAADWMSAASFLGMAGLISFSGSDGSVYLMGWTGGYVLLALLLAPYLRKFGHYTVPDFIGTRYYSETARIVAAICAIFISVTYVAGQMKGVGVVFSRFLAVDLEWGVLIGMVIVAFFAILGGMKGITWTQVCQYIVLIAAFVIPAVAISQMLTGHTLPQLGMTQSGIAGRLNQALIELGHREYTEPFQKFSQLNVFCITAALMFGTAGLPHVIVRFYTVRDVRSARYSAAWAIFFIAILYTTAPALGMFARYNLVKSIHEARIESVEVGKGESLRTFRFPEERDAAWKADGVLNTASGTPVVFRLISPDGEALDWAERWQRTGLLRFTTTDFDGAVSLRLDAHGKSELAHIDQDIIVLATPEVAGLPPWVIALVAAGGLAAALSTASGLLLVISSSLAHDLFCRYVAPHASESQRVNIGRIAIFGGSLIAGYFGINPPGFVGEVVAFAFGLAAASFFPAIFLGIFSTRINRAGATSGMVAGMLFTLVYIVLCTSHKVLPAFFSEPLLPESSWWLGISPQGIGVAGMLLNFAVSIGVSLVTPPPPPKVAAMIGQLRMPGGKISRSQDD
jgi:cation/acetate symporter